MRVDNLLPFCAVKTEKLRRKDQLIRAALAEKQRLVADILHVSHAELESLADVAGEVEGEKDSRHLVMAAMIQGTVPRCLWSFNCLGLLLMRRFRFR